MTEVPSTGHAVPGQSKKVCFVTIGATASFDSLLKAVLATPFLEALRDAKYTDLIIQHGKDKGKAIYDEFMSTQSASIKQSLGLETTGFDFKTNGLDQEMQRVKGDPQSGDEEGLVVSHAGSGSILAALRIGVPLVVVPNTDLLHNHQVELAEELAKQEYVVYGNLNDLAASIPAAEKLRQRQNQWPPPNNGEESYKRGLAGVMDDEMGWID